VKKSIGLVLAGTGLLIMIASVAGFLYFNKPVGSAFEYYKMGVFYAGEQNWDKAIAEFNKAISLDGKYVNAYRERAYARSAKDMLPETISDFERVIELDPNNTDDYRALGSLYSTQGNKSKAITALKNAIKHTDDKATIADIKKELAGLEK